MPEKINISFSSGNPSNPPFKKPINYEDVVQWIKSKNYDDELTEGLIKMAGKFPNGAYNQFKKNINNYVEIIRKSKR